MRCPTLAELPPPPPGKTGWPWTEETPQSALAQLPKGSDWPKVSIVTPSFNQGDFIEETIRSVLLQGYPDLEYIIIDGGSRDNSVAIIQKYERWLGFWVSEPDQGVTNANNKGFAKATGELFGIMCSDDYFMPGGILSLIQLRCQNPGSVAVAGGTRLVDMNGKVIKTQEPFIRDLNTFGDWGFGAWFCTVACLFNGNEFHRLGGLDERFKIVCDIDLWIRLHLEGGSFSLTNDVVSADRVNPNSLSRRSRVHVATELITMNYLHGQIEAAHRITTRYGCDVLINIMEVDPKLGMVPWRNLLPYVGWRFIDTLKRRIFGLIP